jgi:hypothetical protein
MENDGAPLGADLSVRIELPISRPLGVPAPDLPESEVCTWSLLDRRQTFPYPVTEELPVTRPQLGFAHFFSKWLPK